MRIGSQVATRPGDEEQMTENAHVSPTRMKIAYGSRAAQGAYPVQGFLNLKGFCEYARIGGQPEKSQAYD